MYIWTRSSYENIFQDFIPLESDTNSFELVVARNETESFQVLLREDCAAFTINSITFSALTGEQGMIEFSNLQYNYVEYVPISQNSRGTSPEDVIRTAPGYFPDPLSNNRSVDVAAGSTQPVWISLYVPKDTPEGVYAGSVFVHTTLGDFEARLSVEVCAVEIPDGKDARFDYMHHQQITGVWWLHATPTCHKLDPITMCYGYERWTPKWWEVVEDIADKMRSHRQNFLYINVQQLLLDGGTSEDDAGNFTFNWQKFDEYIQFFLDRGIVKGLEGTHIAAIDYEIMHFTTYVLRRNADGVMEVAMTPAGDELSERWLRQYLPALEAHIAEKGWLSIWYQHVGDEAMNDDQLRQYSYYYSKVREFAPRLKVGDPVTHTDFAKHLLNIGTDVIVPLESAYNDEKSVYEQAKKNGVKVYVYNCCGPSEEWLNRFVDKPVWHQRTLGWLLYRWNVEGFLHWGYNFWFNWNEHYYQSIDEDPFKGDHYTIYPDPNQNKVRSSIRYEACRDAAEDFELLTIIGRKDPEKAYALAGALAKDARDDYVKDIGVMIEKRKELVRTAAKYA